MASHLIDGKVHSAYADKTPYMCTCWWQLCRTDARHACAHLFHALMRSSFMSSTTTSIPGHLEAIMAWMSESRASGLE
jgi:hypothetical protein